MTDLCASGSLTGMKHILFFAAVAISYQAGGQSLEVITPQKTVNLSLATLKANLKPVTVKVDDPVYKKPMDYDAFALNDVLKFAGAGPTATADEIVFVAVDGYAPNTEFSKLKKYQAYLAYQVAGSAGFPEVAQGKSVINPGPFYVVWKDMKKSSDHVPWPYQLVKIEVVDWNQKFPLVYPQKAADGTRVKRGFLVFKAECIRCHSMNLQGGDLGPELNFPKNITEYWNANTVKEYIRDNTQFRAKSKMPPFKHLSEVQLNDLMAYLKFMKGQKPPR